MRAVRFALGGFVLVLIAFLLVWPFASGRWRSELDNPSRNQAVSEPEVDDREPHIDTTLPPPSISVATSGRFGSEVLQRLEREYFSDTGESVDVVPLSSDLDVWRLVTDANPSAIDVVEVGFRTDALSASPVDAVIPLDVSAMPNLATLPAEFRLPDDWAAVVGFTGFLGLVVDESASSTVRSWFELESFDPATLVVPAPDALLAPIVVLAVGQGDIEAGVEIYATWIDAGALTASRTDDYIDALAQGAELAIWTSSSLWRVQGRLDGFVFTAPAEGAVALPAITAVPATADDPEAAMAWIDFRLGPTAQVAAASGAEQGTFGREDLAVLSPVLSGLDDLPSSSTAFYRLDAFPGNVVTVDWRSYGEARSALDRQFAGSE